MIISFLRGKIRVDIDKDKGLTRRPDELLVFRIGECSGEEKRVATNYQ